MKKRQVLSWGAVSCAALVAAAAQTLWSTPARAAEADGRVQDQTWVDAKRGRSLPVRLRNAPQPGEAARPTVIFSHGLGGSVAAGTLWAQAWVEAGFFVIHVQHPGSDAAVARQGRRALLAAATGQQQVARVGDVSFVLDELERLKLTRPGQIALAGHSMGAGTTLAVAGQRFPGVTPIVEPRIAAFIAFSPSGAAKDGDRGAAYGEIKAPTMLVTGSEDADVIGVGHTAQGRAETYRHLGSPQRALLWLDGANHAFFGGVRENLTRGAQVSEEALSVGIAQVQRCTSLWLQSQLLRSDAAGAALRAARQEFAAPSRLELTGI